MSTLQDNLFDWVNGQVSSAGFTPVWNAENAPLPEQYVSMKITGLTILGNDYMQEIDPDTLNADMTGSRDFTLMLQTGGDGAFEIATKLHSSLFIPSVTEALKADLIFPVDPMPVQDISSLMGGTDYEERATFDTLMRIPVPYGITSTDASQVIEHVEGIEMILGDRSAETFDINPTP